MPVDTSAVGHRAGPWIGLVDARWLMSYAAGIERSDDVYLDTLRDGGVLGHPVFPVAPEWQLIIDPASRAPLGLASAEVPRGVHAGHDITLHRPITSGERVTVSSQLIGAERTPPGALTTSRFVATGEDGSAIWTTVMRSLYRGVEARGGDVAPPDVDPPPDVAGGRIEQRTVALGPHAAHVYTECARIWNPIHTDAIVAQAAGLPGIILHGTATLAHGVSFAMDVLGAGPDRVARLGGSFRAMVRLPSEITLRVLACDGRVASFEVLNEAGEPAVRDGYVVLRPD
jgi:acyl dehydratase